MNLLSGDFFFKLLLFVMIQLLSKNSEVLLGSILPA